MDERAFDDAAAGEDWNEATSAEHPTGLSEPDVDDLADGQFETNSDARVRVVVSGEDELAPEYLEAVLYGSKAIEVVATCPRFESLEATCLGFKPDVVVLSASPFVRNRPAEIIEVLSSFVAFAERNDLQTAVVGHVQGFRPEVCRAMVSSGATGLSALEDGPYDLIEVILKAAAGETRIAPFAVKHMIRGDGSPLNELTDREKTTFRYVALGYTSRQAAEALYLSERTIEKHRASLNAKLGIKDRRDLMAIAIQAPEAWIEPESGLAAG